MATYGVSFYGSGVLYGEDIGLDFHAANFVAKPVDTTGAGAFESLHVSWLAPSGNWATLRLVRKHSGFAVDHNDGLLLFEDAYATARTAYTDDVGVGGRVAYYSLFVYSAADDEWVRVGNAWSVVVADHGYADILYRFLPNSVVESDYSISSYLPDPQKNPLYRLMETVGFELSHIRTELELLRRAYNPDTLPAPALIALGETFGVTEEPELGLYNTRVATRNATYIAKTKGTQPGVEAAASAYSGWGADYARGRNMLLTWDHTQWFATGSSTVGDGVGGPDSSAEFRLIPSGTGTTRLSQFFGKDDPRLWTIPVEASTEYTFAVDSQVDAAHNHTMKLKVTFFDIDGAVLSTSTSASLNPDDNGTPLWEQVSHTFSTPADTAFAGIEIEVTNTAAATHYFRQAQMVEGDTPMSPYQRPRHTRLLLRANTTNHVTTPSFEHATALAFAPEGAATLALSSDTAKYGSKSLKVTCGLLQERIAATDVPPVNPRSEVFRALFSAKADADTVGTATARLRWYDEYFAVVAESDGPSVTLGSDWVSASVAATAPDAAYAVELVLVLDTGGSGSVVYIDGVLLADSARGVDYFDGTTGEDDTLWEGEPDNSRSFYYRKRGTTNGRLTTLFSRFNPRHLSHEFVYGDAEGLAPNATAFSRSVGAWRAQDSDTGSGTRLLDLSGNDNHMTFGDDATTANDPLLLPYTGTNYLYKGAGLGDRVSFPHSSALDITGDFELEVDCALDNYATGQWQSLLSKHPNTGASGYELRLSTSGAPYLMWGDGGQKLQASNGTNLATLVGNGNRCTIRVTLDVDNGAGSHVVTFYVNGTMHGTETLRAGATTVSSNTKPVAVGERTDPSVGAAGKFYRATVRSGLGGKAVLDVDFTRRPAQDLDNVALVSTATAAWRASNLTANGRQLTDLTGNGHEARFGSDGFAATSNDPKVLSHRGTNYLFLPGTTGGFAQVADAPALNVTGDIDLRCDVMLDDWSSGTTQYLIAKDGFTNGGYYFRVASNARLSLGWHTGAAFITLATVGAVGVDGQRLQVRVTLDVDNGAGSHVVTFYTRPPGVSLLSDDGWELVESAQTGVGTTSIGANTVELQLGARVGASLAAGRMYSAAVLDGINGTPVADIDFTLKERGPVGGLSATLASATAAWRASDVDADGRSLVDLTGNGRPAGFGVDNVGPSTNDPAVLPYDGTRYLYLSGVAPNRAQVADRPGLDITGDIDLRIDAALADWTPATSVFLISKRNSNASVAHYEMTLGPAGNLILQIGNGTAASTYVSTATVDLVNWQRAAVRATYTSATGAVEFYLNGEPLGAVVAGTAGAIGVNTEPLAIGTRASNLLGGLLPLTGRVYSASVRAVIDGSPVYEVDFSSPDAPAPAVSPLLASATGAWRAADADPESSRLRDLTNNSRPALFGSNGAVATANDPKHLPYTGTQYLYTPGGGSNLTNYAATVARNRLTAHESTAYTDGSVGWVDLGGTSAVGVTSEVTALVGSSVHYMDSGSDNPRIGTSTIVPVTPGETLGVSLNVLRKQGALANQARLRLWYTLATATVSTITVDTQTLSDGWLYLSATHVVPAGVDGVQVRVDVDNSAIGERFYVDAAHLSTNADPTYFLPLNVTGDVDLRCDVVLDDSAAGTGNSDLFGRKGNGVGLYLHGGNLRMYYNVGGTLYFDSGHLHGLASGERAVVRATRVASSGVITYYVSRDGGATWDSLGTRNGTAGTVKWTSGDIRLGVTALGVGSFAGRVYSASIRAGVDGLTVYEVDFDRRDLWPNGGASTSGTAVTGQSVTISREATGRKTVLVERPTLLLGTDDHLGVPHHPDFDVDANDDLTVVVVARHFNAVSFKTLLSKVGGASNTGYWLRHLNTAGRPYFAVTDTDPESLSTSGLNPGTPTPGMLATYGSVLDRDAGVIRDYVNANEGDDKDVSTIGSLVNTGEVLIGTGDDLEVYGAAVFVGRVLSHAEITAVAAELMAATSNAQPDGYNSQRTTLVSNNISTHILKTTGSQPATVVDRPALLAGPDDYLTVLGDWSVDADQDLTVVVSMRSFAGPVFGVGQRLVSTYPSDGYVLDVQDPGYPRAWLKSEGQADTHALSTERVTNGGDGHAVSLRFSRSSATVEALVDGVVVSSSAADTTLALVPNGRLGLLADPTGAQPFVGEFYGAAVFVGQALNNEEIAAVAAELTAPLTTTTPPPPGHTSDRRGVVSSGTFARVVRPAGNHLLATLVTKPMLLMGVDDFLTVPHHADFDVDANTDMTVVAVYGGTPHNFDRLLEKGVADTSNPGWRLHTGSSTTTDPYMYVSDGVDIANTSGGADVSPSVRVVGAVLDRTAQTLALENVGGAPPTTVSTAAIGALSSTSDLLIGKSTPNTNHLDAELYGAAVFVGRVLTSEEIAAVGEELLSSSTQPSLVGPSRDHRSMRAVTGQPGTVTRTGEAPPTFVDRAPVVLKTGAAQRLRVPYSTEWDIEPGGDYTVVYVGRQWTPNGTATHAATRGNYGATGSPGWALYEVTGTGAQIRGRVQAVGQEQPAATEAGLQTAGAVFAGALIFDTSSAMLYRPYSVTDATFGSSRVIAAGDDFRSGNPLTIMGTGAATPTNVTLGSAFHGIALFKEVLTPDEIHAVAYQLGYRP